MAPSSLRIVRRPKGSPARRSLTAASQPVTDPQKQSAKGKLGSMARATWQTEAWDFLELVGELAYYVGWRSNNCARVRLVASEIDENTGLPTGGLEEDEDGKLNDEQMMVADIVKAIAGGPMNQPQFVKRMVECLTVPGEAWIAILSTVDDGGNPTDTWLALTSDEWKSKPGDGAEIEMPDGTKHDYVPGVDRLFRVWNPRPRRAREATSPVKACLDPLREIVRTTKKIKNAGKSRLVGGGVWFLPQEMSLPASQAPLAVGAVKPGDPVPVYTGTPAAEQLSDMLYNTASVAVDDEDSQAAFIPLMVTVPGEHLGKILKMDLTKDVTDVEIKTRNDAIARLAMGLDVSPERLLGIGTSSNHWSAWQIGDEDVQLHINPVMSVVCQFITEQVLKAVLIKANIDPAKYVLWFDTSQLTADPDKTDEATKASELGALRNEELLRATGLPENGGYDLTTLEGAQLWAAEAITRDPTLITTLSPLLSKDLEGIEWPTPAPALPPGQDNVDNQDQPTDGAEPNTENADEPTANVSASIAPRLHTPAELILAENLLINRGLDLAAKRRVRTNDHQQRARLNGHPAHHWHRMLPPVTEAEIPRLIEGWDAALEDSAVSILGVDTEQLRTKVRTAIYRELTRDVIEADVS